MKQGWEVGVGGGVFVGDEERERGGILPFGEAPRREYCISSSVCF